MRVSPKEIDQALADVEREKLLAKHICRACSHPATWMYLPFTAGRDPASRFCCDEHVPRGCSCMVTLEWSDFEMAHFDNEKALKGKFNPELHWARDGRGRFLPCMEWECIDPEDHESMLVD